MYESEGLDVAIDGKAWHWAVASAVAIAIVAPLVPLVLLAIAFEKARGGKGNGKHRG